MIKAKQCEPELLTCRPSGAQTINTGGGGQRSHLRVGHGAVRWAQRGSSVLFEGMEKQTDEEIVAGWRGITWGKLSLQLSAELLPLPRRSLLLSFPLSLPLCLGPLATRSHASLHQSRQREGTDRQTDRCEVDSAVLLNKERKKMRTERRERGERTAPLLPVSLSLFLSLSPNVCDNLSLLLAQLTNYLQENEFFRYGFVLWE
ncbi:hypothetical protein QQF64_027177 [Cirrhinus molitorella]|uniref:Uncharacterized protein n=1 Tax=Cirrhinus molitorella TaxID=172907 RepID=A0ABR3NBQ0_9TELE